MEPIDDDIYVLKRDNEKSLYDISKIGKALDNVFIEDSIKNELLTAIDKKIRTTELKEVNIEFIQDIVENTLMDNKLFDTAKAYVLYRHNRNIRREKYGYDISKIPDNITPKFQNDYGYIVFKRTYARTMHNSDKTEEFRHMLLRILTGCQEQLKCGFTNSELNRLYNYMMDFKGLPAGRFLWQLGCPTVDYLGLMSLQNCAFTVANTLEAFTWAFDILLLGTGVGVNVQNHHISKLPRVLDTQIKITRQDDKSACFIVPDTREGWVELLNKVIMSYFVDGKSFTYSTMLIRSQGTPLKKFGGVAAGPEPLCDCIHSICKLLDNAKGKQLTSVEVLDIMTLLGQCVSNGAIRRSAIIVLGDYDDAEFLKCKDWTTGTIPNHRAMSNNSLICNDITKLSDSYWDSFYNEGEVFGLINLNLCRTMGRIKDGKNTVDADVEGVNPCGEIPLRDRGTCCLTELFLSNMENYDEMKDVATLLYRICKHSIALPCHQKSTEKIVHKDMRIGVGITGFAQATDEQKGWLSDLYEYLRDYDIEYSKKNNLSPSVKLTTCKPSGTLSSMAGCTSGIHPAIFNIFQRRLRIATTNPIADICKERGYPWEYQLNFDGTKDKNTTIISFPCKYPEHTKEAKNVSAIEMLESVKWVQTHWADNSVSVTVYYRKEEIPAIKEWLLKNYNDNIKSVSFLLHNEHGFKQAPFEEMTKLEYIAMANKITKIKSLSFNTSTSNSEINTSDECANGICPVR